MVWPALLPYQIYFRFRIFNLSVLILLTTDPILDSAESDTLAPALSAELNLNNIVTNTNTDSELDCNPRHSCEIPPIKNDNIQTL